MLESICFRFIAGEVPAGVVNVSGEEPGGA